MLTLTIASALATLPFPLSPFDPFHRLFDVSAAVEGAEAKVAFPGGSEAAAGSADDVGVVQQAVEIIPTALPFGGFEPDIRGIDAAVHAHAQVGKGLADETGVLEVEINEVRNLLAAFGTVGSLGSSLHDVGNAVELRALAAMP